MHKSHLLARTWSIFIHMESQIQFFLQLLAKRFYCCHCRRRRRRHRRRHTHTHGWHYRNTYSVWMLFIESNVPFANDWILLSYNDNKLKLLKSRNESFRMHEISLAFSSNNCNDVNPRNTFAGKSLILLPYKTLFEIMENGMECICGSSFVSSNSNLRVLTVLSAIWVRRTHHGLHVRYYCLTNRCDAIVWNSQMLSVWFRWWNFAPNAYIRQNGMGKKRN